MALTDPDTGLPVGSGSGLLARGIEPRLEVPRTLALDPGIWTGMAVVEGYEILNATTLSLYAEPGWQVGLDTDERIRSGAWRLLQPYVARVKAAARELYERHGPMRVAVEGQNPASGWIGGQRAFGQSMAEANRMTAIVLGALLGLFPRAVVVAPGRNRGDWHKPYIARGKRRIPIGGTGVAGKHYPAVLLRAGRAGKWPSDWYPTDLPIVRKIPGAPNPPGAHHVYEAFDIAHDAEIRVQREGLGREDRPT